MQSPLTAAPRNALTTAPETSLLRNAVITGILVVLCLISAPRPARATGSATTAQMAAMRLDPRNATGGTDLYSRNFGWGTNLVSLPGRGGLDLNLGISYNSLVWIKDPTHSEIDFNPDYHTITPGFRFGIPDLELGSYTGVGGVTSYLATMPDGSHVEFRSDGSGHYTTADSTYAQLIFTYSGPSIIGAVITLTDGTSFTYSVFEDWFICTKIQDRNGNYISISYEDSAISTITDTLGRVLTFNYDAYGYPSSITQTWKGTNGSGSNATHTWASFSYTNVTVSTSFSGLTVAGPANSSTVKALEKITYADGSFTKFEYNGYVQVKKISQVAADSTSHVLNYVSTDLDSVSGSQTDCPRFGATRSWVENFNLNGSGVPQEIVTTNTAPSSSSFTGPDGSITTSVVKVAMTGDPYNHYTRIHFEPSGSYKEGLVHATEDCTDTGSSCGTRVRWTWNSWTQDNTGVSYILNPRVTETRVGDGTNTKRTTIDYGSNDYGLPEKVKVYDTNLTTVLKTQTTSYNLSSTYTDKRIIGLPSEVNLWEGVDESGTRMSRITYHYDDGSLTGTDPAQNISPTQHDNTNYGSSYVSGRGNLTEITRWDVADYENEDKVADSTIKYNTAGAVVSKTDPLSHTVKIAYTDSFSTTGNPTTYAYPTTLTDQAGNSSTVKYRYDFGANVEATSPAPAGQTYGKTSKRDYDDTTGAITKNSIYVNTTLKYYERIARPSPDNGVQFSVYKTLIDASGSTSGPDSADEVQTETWLDGAGRVARMRTEHPGSTGGWSAVLTAYDIFGRPAIQSVPTEVSVSGSTWTAAGDDSTRGFVYNYTYYDWKGRVVRTVPSDSNGSDDKDTLISYAGCGCAGGQVTTISGPKTDALNVSGTAQTDKRRTEKIYEDILGRVYKTERWDLDGAGSSPYSTTKTTFNGRDQATLIRQYAGSDSSSTYQDTTMTYDGHGRTVSKHLPQQDTSTATGFTYNADDSLATSTDARGMVTTYSYNSRGLVTSLAWTVPSGSSIADPTDVTFSYDDLGNRTQMTDGLGQVDYNYNGLSQMTDETRDFTDTITNAPISGGKFKLEYTYTLGGNIKTLKDPYGVQINYAFDKAGRLTTVAPSSSYAGVSSFASNAQYRAWGGLKHLDMGSNRQTNTTFNDRLLPDHFEYTQSGVSTPLMSKDYQYYKDGKLKFVDDNVNGQFDRGMTYDHAGRVRSGKTWTEASGTSVSPPYTGALPYRQTYTYDAFDNLTSRTNLHWGMNDWNGIETFDQTFSYTNDRDSFAFIYDSDGRVTASVDESLTYNAAGQITHIYNDEEHDTDTFTGGDGKEWKRVENHCDMIGINPTTCTWFHDTKYYVRSSVLGGGVVSETLADGSNGTTTVHAAGEKIAYMTLTSSTGGVSFNVKDPSGMSNTGYLGELELDPLGNNAGRVSPYENAQPEDPCPGCGFMAPFEQGHVNGFTVEYQIDGMTVSQGAFMGMASLAGWGSPDWFFQQESSRLIPDKLVIPNAGGDIAKDLTFPAGRVPFGVVFAIDFYGIDHYFTYNVNWDVSTLMLGGTPEPLNKKEQNKFDKEKKTVDKKIHQQKCRSFLEGIFGTEITGQIMNVLNTQQTFSGPRSMNISVEQANIFGSDGTDEMRRNASSSDKSVAARFRGLLDQTVGDWFAHNDGNGGSYRVGAATVTYQGNPNTVFYRDMNWRNMFHESLHVVSGLGDIDLATKLGIDVSKFGGEFRLASDAINKRLKAMGCK